MYSKSERVIIAFLVVVKICNYNALSSFLPLNRGFPVNDFGVRTAALRSIPENYVGPDIGKSVLSSQNKIDLQSVSRLSNSLSYPDVKAVLTKEKYAERGDFTYQVSIQYYGSPYCAGALLSDRWVLSSANCANSVTLDMILINVGALLPGEGDLYICETIKVHEKFNSQTFENDLALFGTNRPILFHQYVQPIPYYKGPAKACDSERVVVGYKENYGGFSPYLNQYLSSANVSIISNEECLLLLTNIGSPERYFTTTTCVMGNIIDYENLLCSGYSLGGEPLASSASRVLLGVRSVQIDCDSNKPFIFTGLSNFAEWIAANTNVIGVDNM